MSRPSFDQQLFDDLTREGDEELYYRINGLDPHSMYRLDMKTIRHNMQAMAVRVCPHREPIKELFEAGNIAGAFGILGGAVHGLPLIGITALTVYLSRCGVETFCKMYLPSSVEQ